MPLPVNYTTIDKYDISVHFRYASWINMVEETRKEFHLEDAASIPPQTHVVTTQVQLLEMDRLLGFFGAGAGVTPWAFFYPPKEFRDMRFSPFAFGSIVPGLKDEDELGEIKCETEEEETEKSQIIGFLKVRRKLNTWLGFVRGRIGQFLQG